MFFVNLVGNSYVGKMNRRGNRAMPITNNISGQSQSVDVLVENGCIVIKEAKTSTGNVFLKDLVSGDKNEVYHRGYGFSYTHSVVADSDENPIICVLTDNLQFFKGVKTNIKYIRVSDNVALVCLIYGAYQVTLGDGTTVPLVRCCSDDVNLNYPTGTITPKELYSFSNTYDKEARYDYGYDLVSSVIVEIKEESRKFKTVNESCYFLDKSNLDLRRKKATEAKELAIKAREEEREKRRLIDREAEMKARQKVSLEEAKQYANANANVIPKEHKPRKPKVESRAVGPQAFMEALAMAE